MKDKNFWLLNGWIIAALLLTVFMLNSLGLLETVKYSKVDCYLGDGIDCLETYIYTESVIGKSNGSKKDEIVFFFTNNLDTEINNFSIFLPNCIESEKINTINPNTTINYNVTKCSKLDANGFFKSELIIKYDIVQNNKSFSMLSTGYISNYVYSPKMERIDKTAKRNIFSWINKNIG